MQISLIDILVTNYMYKATNFIPKYMKCLFENLFVLIDFYQLFKVST
jgi:hypothetical protein